MTAPADPGEGSPGAAPQEELARLYDDAPVGYLTTTPDGTIVRVNATLCTWLRMRTEEMLGRHLTELLTAGGRIYHETHYSPMVQIQGFVREIAIDLVRADGSRLPVLLNASTTRTPGGEPHLVQVAVFDATERRAYERELVRTRDEQQVELDARTEEVASAAATLSQIVDAATNTLLVAADTDLVITHVNTGAQEMLGYARAELVGRSAEVLLDSDEGRRHAAALDASCEPLALVRALVGHGAPRDWAIGTRTGERRTMSLSFTEIRDGDRLLGYLCAGEDVSARLRLEASQAAALQRELESVARLEEADRVKDEVVSTISHELRTPLASIRGYGEVLADGDLGDLAPAQADAVAKMLRNAARLSALVEDLLHLDRLGSATDVRGPVGLTDLGALVLECRDSLQPLASARAVRLEVYLPDAPVLIPGDARSLERIVLNLGDNAVKFSSGGGPVALAITTTATTAVLTVTDSGIGMSEEDRVRVRERFYRSSEAYRRAVPGTGLGLSVVDSLVTAHRGALRIASTLGEGTIVTVELPLLGSGAGEAGQGVVDRSRPVGAAAST